jgi:hypothetical protein
MDGASRGLGAASDVAGMPRRGERRHVPRFMTAK